jgi:hypothetical protein
MDRKLITICGAGAIGSNLAESLARQGFWDLRAIDRDRVEPRNLTTQAYNEGDVGARKVDALKMRIFRAIGAEIEAVGRELSPPGAKKLLAGSALVVDAFDNSASRRAVQGACREAGIPCLHAGAFPGYAEVLWDGAYAVPPDPAASGAGEPPCDYPLGRNLVLLAVAAAGEAIRRWSEGVASPEGWTITLDDLVIAPRPPGDAATP